ncbi:MAG: hypothetical protein NVSMB9_21010 [Isosphaeraceae bacterium]
MDCIAVGEPVVSRPSTRSWCLFHCGKMAYAIDLEAVAEVVEIERLVKLPRSPSCLLGLCSLRREVIPVFALAENEHNSSGIPAEPASRSLVLILRTLHGTWGIRIDAEGTAVVKEERREFATTSDDSVTALQGTVQKGDVLHAVIDAETTWKHMKQSVEKQNQELQGATSTRSHPTPRSSRSERSLRERT